MRCLVEEDTLAIVEGVEVSCSVLLVHSLSGDLLGDHVSDDTAHSSTSVVDLGVQLAGLLRWVKDVSTEVTNSVVTIVLGCGPPCNLDETDESKDLGKSSSGNREDSVDTSGDIRELQVVGGGDVSIEGDVVVVDDASNNGSHSNTSVLALDSTTAFEGLGLGIHPSEGIEDTEGLGGSKLELIDVQGSGGLKEKSQKLDTIGISTTTSATKRKFLTLPD
jgi:hypothetical protein